MEDVARFDAYGQVEDAGGFDAYFEKDGSKLSRLNGRIANWSAIKARHYRSEDSIYLLKASFQCGSLLNPLWSKLALLSLEFNGRTAAVGYLSLVTGFMLQFKPEIFIISLANSAHEQKPSLVA